MNILTFDLEDWFHILENRSTATIQDWETIEGRFSDNVERILRILKRHDQPATFFCMGWIARKYPHIIRNIASLGYEVGCHSNMHHLLTGLTPASFKQSLKDAIVSIEDITGKPVRSYRAPGFSITRKTLWAFEILAECGIENDCSIFPAKRAHGGYPDFPVLTPSLVSTPSGTVREFPVNILSFAGKKIIFSGGGYFRVMPYPLIRRMTRRSDYIMTYFHPRDFDPGQPRIADLSAFRRFKSYVGLSGAEEKLEKWLEEFEFVTLEKAAGIIDWTSVPTLIPDETKNNLRISRPGAAPEKGSAIAVPEGTMQLMGFTIHTKLNENLIRLTNEAGVPRKLLISCMNPHSYCLSKKDPLFREALERSDILIPDGSGIVLAARILKFKRIRKIAGADLHDCLLKRLNEEHGSCFYLGVSQKTLDLIRDRLSREFPNITAGFHSPPYKEEFTEEESNQMIAAFNNFASNLSLPHSLTPSLLTSHLSPHHRVNTSPVLFVGMTAPKQEKWAYRYKDQLDAGVICAIGAVFDFYAGTVKRSSSFWISIGLEWLPRFLKEPRRLYRRVFVSGPNFLWDVLLYRSGIK